MRDNCCNHHVENNDDDISITLLSQMSSRSSLTFDFSAHHSTSRLCLHQILMTCLGRAAAGAWIHGFLKVANNHQILNMQQGFLIFELQFQMLPSIRLQLWRRFQLQSLTIRSPFWHNSGSSVFCLFVTEATQFCITAGSTLI